MMTASRPNRSNTSHRSRLARLLAAELSLGYVEALRRVDSARARGVLPQSLRDLDAALQVLLRDVAAPLPAGGVLAALGDAALGDAALGDEAGWPLGFDGTVPLLLDPLGSWSRSLPPVMLVAGAPGSGKSALAQRLWEAPRSGLSVLVVSDLDFVPPPGATVVRVGAASSPGLLDPARLGSSLAASLAFDFLALRLEERLSAEDLLVLERGLKAGFNAGAACTLDALSHVGERVRALLLDLAASSWQSALALGSAPLPPLPSEGRIVFVLERSLGLPSASTAPADFSPSERAALSTLSHLVALAGELLAGAGGGPLVVDDASFLLECRDGVRAVTRIGRESRSSKVLPVLVTRSPSLLLEVGLASYVSRVFLLRTSLKVEASAGLSLLGLEVTPERLEWLRSCGPSRSAPVDAAAEAGAALRLLGLEVTPERVERLQGLAAPVHPAFASLPPRGLHRDLAGRLGVFSL